MPPNQSSNEEIFLEENLNEKFSKILKANGIFDEILSITMEEPLALKGQHYTTAAIYVRIVFKNISLKPKNLFLKKYHKGNSSQTAMLRKNRVMEKEREFLNEFVPDVQEFCRKYHGSDDLFDFFPKCLYGDAKIIVLENLVLDNSYVMLPKEKFQDLDTAKFALANLAKFHATTSIMIKEIGKETFIKRYPLTTKNILIGPMKQSIVNMLNDGIDKTLRILKKNPAYDSDYAIEMLSRYAGKGLEILDKTVQIYSEEEDKFLCLIHGDFWNNNMLFKVDSKSGKAYKLKFVDFQTSQLSSLCYDIAYYIYLSIKLETRLNYLQDLLSHYFDTYKEVWESFGKNCPFTFEELLQDFYRRNGFAFFFGLSFIAAFPVMKNVDVTKVGDNTEDMTIAFSEAINIWSEENPLKVAQLVEELITGIKDHFANNNN